jgi:hypothetical protein
VFIAQVEVGDCDVCGERDVVVVELSSIHYGAGCWTKACRECLRVGLEEAEAAEEEFATIETEVDE